MIGNGCGDAMACMNEWDVAKDYCTSSKGSKSPFAMESLNNLDTDKDFATAFESAARDVEARWDNTLRLLEDA